jgi:hypothetical protein
MTITLDIKPEVQAELARQAAAHGQAIENYAADLLEEAVRPPETLVAGPEANDMVELLILNAIEIVARISNCDRISR